MLTVAYNFGRFFLRNLSFASVFAKRASGVNWSEKTVTRFTRMKIQRGELKFLPKYLERGSMLFGQNLKAGYAIHRFIAFLLAMFLNIFLKGPMSYPRYSPHNKSQKSYSSNSSQYKQIVPIRYLFLFFQIFVLMEQRILCDWLLRWRTLLWDFVQKSELSEFIGIKVIVWILFLSFKTKFLCLEVFIWSLDYLLLLFLVILII